MYSGEVGSGLPISLDDLIRGGVVEDNRREFKKTWDEQIKSAVVKTTCAFANDLLNLNGGYIVLGIEDDGGRPILPPAGLDAMNLERIQKEIRGACKRIVPEYQPLIAIERYQEKIIAVIWAPGGDNRPYQAPVEGAKDRMYYVRQGSETVAAQGDVLRQLMERAAKIPFDDRRAFHASLDDLSPSLVRRFLTSAGSSLAGPETEIEPHQTYRQMRVSVPINSHEAPRNVALLFFSEDPGRWFPGARIEIVQFSPDGDLIEERVIKGPLDQQVRETLQYVDGLSGSFTRKAAGEAQSEKTVAYPYEAIREALVNAVYHRSYDGNPEPVKVHLHPDRMEIVSYPGPVPGIEVSHLESGKVPPVAARNRRVGEMLKELRLAEGRGTGVPKIRRRLSEIGSGEPVFDFDVSRTYFRVTLPAHPRYQMLHALRENTGLWILGEKAKAIEGLRRVFDLNPGAGALAAQIIEYATQTGDFGLARQTFEAFHARGAKSEPALPYLRFANALSAEGRHEEANAVLDQMPPTSRAEEAIEAAILRKRRRDFQEAHRLFELADAARSDDAKVLHEFAQTKMALYRQIREAAPGGGTHLLRQAAELLRRSVTLSRDNIRRAWCWYDLAECLIEAGDSRHDIEHAFTQAISLLEEQKFREGYERWKAKA